MTNKVTMPDPQLIVDFCENADLHVWEAGNERSVGVVRNASRGEYITTTQAEAYADARVRAALESIADAAHDACIDYCNGRAVDFKRRLEAAAHDLLPPLPGPASHNQ